MITTGGHDPQPGQLLKEYLINKNKIDELTQRNAEIVDELGLRFMPLGVTVIDGISVTVSANVRFDPELAAQKYPIGPEGQNMDLYSATVDAKLAKEKLTPEEYAALQKRYPNNKVEVRLDH